LDVSFGAFAIASDGDGFLLTGGRLRCRFMLCYPNDVRAVRLNSSLQRVGAEIEIAPDGSEATGVVWNGADYVVVWQDGTGSGFTRIAPGSDAARTQHIPMWVGNADIVPASGGNLAILYLREDAVGVRFFEPDGTLRGTTTVARPYLSFYRNELVPLAGGAVAHVGSRVSSSAPHYGAIRVAMTIFGGPGIAPPSTPHVTVREESARFVVEWSAPAGTVNGYRLEHRTDDGSWIELERWFGPAEQSVSIRRPSFGTKLAFRVRAFNDAGMSEYSPSSGVNAPRRRSVRR